MRINKSSVLTFAFALIFALIVAGPAALTLQAANELRCVITDAAGNPVPKNLEVALVATAGKDTGKEWKKKTDDKGVVEFKGLPDGTFQLEGGMEGHFLSKNPAHDLAGDVKETCNPSLVSVDVVNQVLMQANEATRSGNVDAALAKGKEAVEMAPDIANTHFVLAVAYAKKGLLEEATASAKKAAELHPEQFEPMQTAIKMEALGTQAGALMAQKDFDGAIKVYEQVEALNPSDGVVHYNIALAYGHKGDLESALRHIDKAIELDPSDPEFQQRKAQLQEMYLKSTEQMLELPR